MDGIERITDIPSACADRLARDEVDAGLIPSVEAARIPGIRIVRGIGIASRERVRSVLLASKVPFERIQSVALDIASRSSNAMVRILLEDLYGLRPDYHTAAPDLEEMLRHYDAGLIIGDPALKTDLTGIRFLDLAEAWRRLTGLPFVFALWAVRPNVAPEPFLWARDFGKRHLDEAVAAAAERTRLPQDVLREYLDGNLHHDLDEDDERGLAEFYRRASDRGLIESSELPPFAGVPLVPRWER